MSVPTNTITQTAIIDAPAHDAPRRTPPARAAQRRNPILYPPRTHGRYYLRKLMREHLEAIAERHLAGRGTLVDFGCGTQPWRPLFEHRVARCVGIDLPGSDHADAHLAPDGRAPIADGEADAVLSTQVLEHVADPAAYLAECRRMLAPDGRLVLSTHGVWKYHPHPTDYYRWTAEGLRRQLEASGFAIDEWRGLLGPAACGLLLLQDAVIVKLPRPLRSPVAYLMQRLGMLADRLHTQNERDLDASVFIAVARKLP